VFGSISTPSTKEWLGLGGPDKAPSKTLASTRAGSVLIRELGRDAGTRGSSSSGRAYPRATPPLRPPRRPAIRSVLDSSSPVPSVRLWLFIALRRPRVAPRSCRRGPIWPRKSGGLWGRSGVRFWVWDLRRRAPEI
jgi:hypothetical protein